ncbi:surface carbohydrate biosynthesis protein [Methylopila capsulata]|uniref:Surface carbohydrate biosynthesis protein n=2 Tax=Methylopila capsulata TaxID=61654 RepID=A0A9W6IW95_9HYPH|nr:surface carbohydrate biosynthesis protein [Methylopila capsulata]GLK57353.1 hypothetical protein GCM10008170_33730 [Methylopila capsulata]
MDHRQKHLIIPVETAARELDAKLLLSLHAAQRGIAVTIGVKALVNLSIHRLSPGVFLPPNFHRSSDVMIKIAGNLGHVVAAWDEEGMVWLNEPSYRERRASRAALAGLDAIFLWGAQQAAALAPALAGLSADVSLVGNPRADLLRPELRTPYQARAAALKAEHGDFILINSNFGWVNHLLGHGQGGDGSRDLEAIARKSKFPAAYLAHRLALYEEMTAVLPAIARRFPNRRIVVRPHPDENDRRWREASAGLPNVIVRYDSDLLPWLLAAGHIVQNGCTTAIEAAMLDRVAISYRPIVAPDHEIPQPTQVSLDARTPDALLEMLAQADLTDSFPADKRAALETMVASIDGRRSSERVIDTIEALLAAGRPAPSPWRRVIGHGQALRRRISQKRRAGVPGSSASPAYFSHKFPPIETSEIERRLAAFGEALAMKPPSVRRISDRIFRLTPT